MDWRRRFATTAMRATLVVGLSLVVQCGPTNPSGPVTGNWRFTAGKFRVYEMSLTQTRLSISGVVCSYSLGVLSPTPREAPVTGEYPVVRFTDPFVPSCTYNAIFEKDRDQIAGDCNDRNLVRFNREGSGRCEPR
jgi:hypothetical protein